jgi:hypothetical protein
VNGENGARRVCLAMQKCGNETGLPVMAVYHIRFPAEINLAGANLCGNHGKTGKTFCIVRPVMTAAIDIGITWTIKQFRAVYQPYRHSRLFGVDLEDLDMMQIPPQLYFADATDAKLMTEREYITVGRQQDTHIGTLFT